jgi:MFS transporter, SP family, general alpha glucoside:H+ symporter
MDMNKATPDHVEYGVFDRDWRDQKFTDKTTQEVAKSRAVLEADLTPWEAIKAYPMAIFWSLMVSMCVIMEGYDTILIGNFFAYPTFQRKYGSYVGVTQQTPSGHQVSAPWQAGVGQASGVGAFIGVLANGYLVALFGQKRILLCSLVLLAAFIFITFFAPSIGVLTAGEVLCGLPWYFPDIWFWFRE